MTHRVVPKASIQSQLIHGFQRLSLQLTNHNLEEKVIVVVEPRLGHFGKNLIFVYDHEFGQQISSRAHACDQCKLPLRLKHELAEILMNCVVCLTSSCLVNHHRRSQLSCMYAQHLVFSSKNRE